MTRRSLSKLSFNTEGGQSSYNLVLKEESQPDGYFGVG